jgi:hypothetical protein
MVRRLCLSLHIIGGSEIFRFYIGGCTDIFGGQVRTFPILDLAEFHRGESESQI